LYAASAFGVAPSGSSEDLPRFGGDRPEIEMATESELTLELLEERHKALQVSL
jgi:hypothetical protein